VVERVAHVQDNTIMLVVELGNISGEKGTIGNASDDAVKYEPSTFFDNQIHLRQEPTPSEYPMTCHKLIRLFWWHPRLTDYRLKLFESLADKFDVRFLFQQPSTIPNNLNSAHVSSIGRMHIPKSGLACLNFQDMVKLWDGVRWSHVFISSFVWNSYTIIGLALCRLFNKKAIVWEETNVIFPGLLFTIRNILMQVLFRHVDAFFVPGEVHKDTLVKLRIPPHRIFVANEYPGHVYSEVEPRKISLPFDENVKIILYLGRLVPVKGVDYLVKAFKWVEGHQDDVALVVVGSGPSRQDLEALTKSLGIRRVFFAGYISDVNARAFLFRRSSIVVVPSVVTHNMHEGGPIVVLEALSAGRPVIGTNASPTSTAFIHDGENGYIVQQKNVHALADKILVLLENPISADQVFSVFHKIRGHSYQVEQLQRAIRQVLELDSDDKPQTIY
jgi:glycosyltransferase involved in cell wall biosynthesis